MTDSVNAFVPGPEIHINGAADGALSGMTFAAKDLFDVAGYHTGGGNPDWGRDAPNPDKHSWAVQTLLDNGASLTGKTITDEVSLGILGENAFYGTPLNSAAPDRVPGGSSSGSAAAVAAGLCDTAIGTDTGGSVRVPASFCGLYGIRPTHGRINPTGMLPQAPGSDTTGWLARDAETFAHVSEVMLGESCEASIPTRLIIATDAFGFADEPVREALKPMVAQLGELVDDASEDVMAPQGLSVWGRAQRTLQPAEAWDTFKDWINDDNPRVSFNVARGLIAGSTISAADLNWAALMRREARARLGYLLRPGTILCQPTTPFPAPLKGLPLNQLNTVRDQIMCLCAYGGLTGVATITIPGATVDGAPVGLSIIGAQGSDAMLVGLARVLANKNKDFS
mgnify:CR=1 FL=1